MRRRDFMVGLGGAFARPFLARAQQPVRMRRIGALMPLAEDDPEANTRKTAFEQGLQNLGWTDGRNVRIDYRWGAGGEIDRMRALATELVGLRPDVLLAGATPQLAALRQATSTIPIVFALVGDPIGGGFVASLARPGSNITGFITVEPPLAGKWVELLKETVPQVRRVAFLYSQGIDAYAAEFFRYAKTAGAAYTVELIDAPVRNAAEIEGTLGTLARQPNAGLIVLPGELTAVHRDLIIALATRFGLPSISSHRLFANAGGLIAYGDDLDDGYRLAAGYIARILQGEKPADLPVQAPVRFELIVNLRTAKAIGLTIPETFLVRADQVIE